MRTKHFAIVVCAAALVSAFAGSVTGQQEPLPVVQPKRTVETVTPAELQPEPAIVLASYPIREYVPPTLDEAARNNDYVSFDALYRDAKLRGEDVSAYATLHELWTWAIGDPIGAFYGREIHTRLARAYPDYAAYINDYAITDSNGNTFWPTSETRTFLLARATAGEAPTTQLAEVMTPAAPAPKPLSPLRGERVAGGRVRGVAKAPTPAPAPAPIAETSPVVVETAPAVVITTPHPQPLSPQSPAKVAEDTTTTRAIERRENGLANRGILLLVLGLIGVGLLAVIFRTPKEDDDYAPHADVTPITPLRKPAAPDETPRATGSHG